MPETFRIGIVGANPARGWARDAHIPALQSLPGVRITAVSARSMAIADEAAAAFGADKAFDDSIALTNSPDVDIVAVTVKVPEHRAIVLSALAAGKHVYCEWPLGRNLAETEEMAAAALNAGVHVAIGLQGITAPAVEKAASLVQAGELGKLHSLRAFSPTAGWGSAVPGFYAYLNDKRNGATLATITGGHTLAVVTRLVGDYSEINAAADIRFPKVENIDTGELIERTCADHISVTGRHHSGCVSEVEIAGGQPPDSPFLLELKGSEGELWIASDHPGGYQVGNLTLSVNGKTVELNESVADLHIGPPSNVAALYDRFFSDIKNATHTVPDFGDAVHLSRLLKSVGLIL